MLWGISKMNFLMRSLLGAIALLMIIITIASAVSAYPVYYYSYPSYNSIDYVHDDLNHFDSFEGYKDLDIYMPDGTISVIRNENPSEAIWDDVNEDGVQLFGYHVYGVLPDGSIYKKHYMHEHSYSYDYAGQYTYGGFYYTPYIAYVKTPAVTRPCQQKDICQKLGNCC